MAMVTRQVSHGEPDLHRMLSGECAIMFVKNTGKYDVSVSCETSVATGTSAGGYASLQDCRISKKPLMVCSSTMLCEVLGQSPDENERPLVRRDPVFAELPFPNKAESFSPGVARIAACHAVLASMA